MGVAVAVLGASASAAPGFVACSSDSFVAPEDAASEASGPDAASDGPATDAGADGAARGCASLSPPPIFCADFDEGSAIAGWDSVDHPGFATVGLDTRFAVSPPASVLVHVDGANPQCAYERMHHATTRAFTRATLSFAVRTGDDDGGSFRGAAVAAFIVRTNAGSTLVLVDTSPFAADIHEQYPTDSGSFDEWTPFPLLSAGVWHEVALDVDLSAAPATFAVTVDGRAALGRTPFRATLGTAGTGVEVQMGPFCLEADAGPLDLRFDDVALDLR